MFMLLIAGCRAFDVSCQNWIGSVLEEYLGCYEDVKSKCPSEIAMVLWVTALSIKIFEIKMEDEKELWELIMYKSMKFLKVETNKIKGDFQRLMDQAEEVVKCTQ